MKQYFLPYNLSLLLKEKGFNELCLGRYTIDGELHYPQPWYNYEVMGCTAPLYDQVIDWFLDTHGIHVGTVINIETLKFMWETFHFIEDEEFCGRSNPSEFIYDTRQLALNAAIEYAITLI